MSKEREILDRLLSSDVKGDLLLLFHKNPGLIDTMESVARRIGRVTKTIETDIRDLVDLGVLKTKHIGRFEVFLLDRARDKELQKTIASYIRSLKKG